MSNFMSIMGVVGGGNGDDDDDDVCGQVEVGSEQMMVLLC